MDGTDRSRMQLKKEQHLMPVNLKEEEKKKTKSTSKMLHLQSPCVEWRQFSMP